MDERKYALLGAASPLVAYIFIGVSIVLSPWFSWRNNALSDLGNAVKSGVAPIFNLGVLLTGFLVTLYAVTTFRKHARYASICLAVSAFLLQLIATFDEVYGFLHYAVSVLFFISLGVTLVAYGIEKRSVLAVVTFIIGFAAWVMFWAGVYVAGEALPEAISATAAASVLVSSSLRIYFRR